MEKEQSNRQKVVFPGFIIRLIFSLFLLAGSLTVHADSAFAIEMKSKVIMWKQVEVVESMIKQKNWHAAGTEVYKLKRMYEKNRWKMQIMGDEAEIEGLQQAINQLIASVENRDDKDCNKEIADIRTYLRNIYEL